MNFTDLLTVDDKQTKNKSDKGMDFSDLTIVEKKSSSEPKGLNFSDLLVDKITPIKPDEPKKSRLSFQAAKPHPVKPLKKLTKADFEFWTTKFADRLAEHTTGYKPEQLITGQKKLRKAISLPVSAVLMGPLYALGFEALNQAKNAFVSSIKKEEYSALDHRMLSELIPDDANKIVKGGAYVTEVLSDIALMSAAGSLARQGMLKSTLTTIGKKLSKAGYGEGKMTITADAIKKAARGTTLEQEAAWWVKSKAVQIKPKGKIPFQPEQTANVPVPISPTVVPTPVVPKTTPIVPPAAAPVIQPVPKMEGKIPSGFEETVQGKVDKGFITQDQADKVVSDVAKFTPKVEGGEIEELRAEGDLLKGEGIKQYEAAFLDTKTDKIIKTGAVHDLSKLTKKQADIIEKEEGLNIDNLDRTIQDGFVDKTTGEYLSREDLQERFDKAQPALKVEKVIAKGQPPKSESTLVETGRYLSLIRKSGVSAPEYLKKNFTPEEWNTVRRRFQSKGKEGVVFDKWFQELKEKYPHIPAKSDAEFLKLAIDQNKKSISWAAQTDAKLEKQWNQHIIEHPESADPKLEQEVKKEIEQEGWDDEEEIVEFLESKGPTETPIVSKEIAKDVGGIKPTPKTKNLTDTLTKQIKDQKGSVNVSAVTEPLLETLPTVAGKVADELARYRGLSSDVVEKFVASEEALPQIAAQSLAQSKELLGNLSAEIRKALQYALEEGTPVPAGTEEIARQIRDIQDWALAERRDRGYFKGTVFPQSTINALTEEVSKINVKIKKIEAAKTSTFKKLKKELENITELERQRDQILKRVEKLEKLKYVHRVTRKAEGMMALGKRVSASVSKKISTYPYHFIGRKFDTIREAEAAGYKAGDLIESIAETINDVRVEALKDELIKAINENPNFTSKQPKEGWSTVDSRIMPAAQGKYYHPVMAKALKQLSWSEDRGFLLETYDNINVFGKMIGFYNPLIMTKNDIAQGWRAAGIDFFANIPKAMMMHINKDPKILEWEKQGLYNNILDYKPAIREMARQMVEQMDKTLPQRAYEELMRDANPFRILDTLMRVNSKTTWEIDKVLRTAARLGIQNKKVARGLSDFEITDKANDFMANYAKFPKQTRRLANRTFFTPTYRISMARILKDMLKHPSQHRAQLLRHYLYLAFMKYVLPSIAGMYVMKKYGKKVKTWVEGYRLVIQDEKGEKVVSFSDPLLEQTKLMHRKPQDTLYFNFAAVPQFILTWLKRGQFDYPKDDLQRVSEYFKIGGPGLRDYLNWRDKDKTNFEKWMTQLGIAYIYSREPYKHKETERAIWYKVLDAMDFVPHWFLSKEERDRVNTEQAYKYYRSRISKYEREYMRTKSSEARKKMNDVEAEVEKKYGIKIRRTKQARRSIRRDIKLREKLTKEEYRLEKTSKWTQKVIKRRE